MKRGVKRVGEYLLPTADSPITTILNKYSLSQCKCLIVI